MATIRKRNDKYVVIYDYTNGKGERKQRWETFDKKTDADKRAKHIDMMFLKLRTKKVSGSRASGKGDGEIPYLSSTTRRHIYVLLKSAMDKAVEWKLIGENPVVCDPPERSTKETATWDMETLQAALEMIEDELLHLAVHIAFIGSMRIGEAMALSWDDVDFTKWEIHIRKTVQRVSKVFRTVYRQTSPH